MYKSCPWIQRYNCRLTQVCCYYLIRHKLTAFWLLIIGVFTIGPLGPCPPPLNCEKISRMAKKCNQSALFSGKNLKQFLGRGHSPRPYPHWGGKYPWPDPSPRRRSPRPPPNFFPISIITLDSDAVIDEFRKSNRRLVLSVDLGLLNVTRLEVGPINIQSSHWINLLMQFVMHWCTRPANSIINIRHSVRITYDIYTRKHTFSMTILWNITCKCAWKSLKLLLPDVRF